MNHVHGYSSQVQSQSNAGPSVPGAKDTTPVPDLKRKASTDIAKEANKDSGDLHAMQSRCHNPVMNDPSDSQRPTGAAAEPGKAADDSHSKHSFVVCSASEVRALADRAAKRQKGVHTIQPNHQSTLLQDDASKTECLAGNAAEPKQNTIDTKSEQQSLVTNDASETFMKERRAQKDERRIEAIIKATSSLKASTKTPNPSPSSDSGTLTLTKQETSILADLAQLPMMSSSQATTRCPSPESEYRNFCLKASKDENRTSNDNPYLSNSPLDESLHGPPDSDVSAGLTSPTDLLRQSDDSEEVEDEFLNSDQDFVVNEHQAMSKKRISRILQGLASTLKVAGEMPKRRPKPSYAYEDPDPFNNSQAMGEM